VQPYIGGGLGMALADVNVQFNPPAGGGLDDTAFGFAGQLGAGVKFAVGDSFDVDIGYRFKAVSEVVILGNDGDYNGKGSFYAQVLQAGASLKF
jgi:opacity protein-like surface antigen